MIFGPVKSKYVDGSGLNYVTCIRSNGCVLGPVTKRVDVKVHAARSPRNVFRNIDLRTILSRRSDLVVPIRFEPEAYVVTNLGREGDLRFKVSIYEITSTLSGDHAGPVGRPEFRSYQ